MLKVMARWAIPFVGIVYATGFLIVFSFLERFGIRGAGSEFFKIKYVHVGILYILFPIIVVIPSLATKYMLTIEKELDKTASDRDKSKRLKVFLPSIILFLNMLFIFYILVALIPTKIVFEREHLIVTIYGASLFGMWLLLKIGNWRRKLGWGSNHEDFDVSMRWILCLSILLVLDVYILLPSFGLLGQVISEGGINFLAFMGMAGFAFWRFKNRSAAMDTTPEERFPFWVLGACVLFALFYLSVLSFALRVYPYIPAAKGGGDYSDSPCAVLLFKGKVIEEIPEELRDPSSMPSVSPRRANDGSLKGDKKILGQAEKKYTIFRSRPLIVIEETDKSIFVARPDDNGGPREWRKRRGQKPRIFEICRDQVLATVYDPEKV